MTDDVITDSIVVVYPDDTLSLRKKTRRRTGCCDWCDGEFEEHYTPRGFGQIAFSYKKKLLCFDCSEKAKEKCKHPDDEIEHNKGGRLGDWYTCGVCGETTQVG